MMYERLFNLKLKITKLNACLVSLYKEIEKYREKTEEEKEMFKEKSEKTRLLNLVRFWLVFGVLAFIKAISGMGDLLYDVLYFVNYFSFLAVLVGNLFYSFKKNNKYEDDITESLINAIRISTIMLTFLNSLEKKYQDMLDKLNVEERNEYEKYTSERQEQLDGVLRKNYSLDDVNDFILEIISEKVNNMPSETDYEYYDDMTKEYLEHIAVLATDYLLEEEEVLQEETVEVEENKELEEVKKKTLL